MTNRFSRTDWSRAQNMDAKLLDNTYEVKNFIKGKNKIWPW